MLYFIGVSKYIKIGVSSNPWGRMTEFQTANPEPLEMLAIAPGDYGFESELHKLFGGYRHSGEWFIDCEPIREFIGFMRRLFPDLQEPPKAVVVTEERQEETTDNVGWRIERRSYVKKDGSVSVYQNYRERKTERDPATGQRRIKYRPVDEPLDFLGTTEGWVEFRPGPYRKDGTRKFYPKRKTWRKDDNGWHKVYLGRAKEYPILEESEYEEYKRSGTMPQG